MPEVEQEREKAWLAALLAWVAGFVDAVGYIILFHLFTAHMSGNTVGMGVQLGQRNWAEALPRAVPIPLFVAGVALGSLITEIAYRRKVRSLIAVALGTEVVLLLVYIVYGNQLFQEGAITDEYGWPFYELVALSVLALGIQASTLQKIGGHTVRTVYITGMLTNMATEGVKWGFWFYDHMKTWSFGRCLRATADQVAFNRAALLSGIWIAYTLGAIAGSLSEQYFHILALLLPVAILICVVILDLVHPIHSPGGIVSDR